MESSAARVGRDARVALTAHEKRLESEAAGRDSQPPLGPEDHALLLGKLGALTHELAKLSELLAPSLARETEEFEALKGVAEAIRNDHARHRALGAALAQLFERHPKLLDAIVNDNELTLHAQPGWFDRMRAVAHGEVAADLATLRRQIPRIKDIVASLEALVTRTARAHAAHSDLTRLREAKARGEPLTNLIHHLPAADRNRLIGATHDPDARSTA